MLDSSPHDEQKQTGSLSISDDVLTAYLELALKIYLRIKNEGKSIHTCGFDDDAASSVPSSLQRPFPPTNSDSNA
jgi:hypothetical protein